jgi:DNA modification methylase
LYGWLSEFAYRVLKEGSYLVAYGGAMWIPEHLSELNTYLKYFWLEPLLHHGGYPRVWKYHLMSGYKPLYVFTKGEPKYLPWRSSVHSDTKDKEYHEWGQGIGTPTYFLEMLTNPGDIVVDPFCGGGNVLAAAKVTGRHYFGIEIDHEQANRTAERLKNQQAPLFVLPRQEIQLGLDLEETPEYDKEE